VGVISGGKANNIVPDSAQATFEFRFRDPDGEREVTARIQELAASVTTPGCGAVFEVHHRRPCMVPVPGTDKIVATLKEAAKMLGQRVETENRGGASDGNFLSEMGVPVVDGLGPMGDMDHSDKEYAVTETVFERIELTALLLCKLSGLV
jgi:glutamate carboxypeptidase